MAVRFQLRRDTANNWASVNPVLALGEPGVETDTLKVKVGDGSNAWNSLGYTITTQFADLNGKPTTIAGYGITDALALANFSVGAEGTASGDGAIAYDNTTGVFTYTPPDLTSYLTSYSETSGLNDVVSRGSTTAQAVTINNTLTVGNVVTNGSGTPEIVSTSTITLDAPDGTLVQSGPFRLPSFTTAQKNAQSSVNGDMVYDSTLNKAQVYENGAWANLA